MGKKKKTRQAAYDWSTKQSGVYSRHSGNCPIRDGKKCTCGPRGFRAIARGPETDLRVVSPTFESLPEALDWQGRQRREQESLSSIGDRSELGALIEEFIEAAEDGVARDPHGQPFTQVGLRELRGGLSYVDSELGGVAVQDVRRRHIQKLVTQLQASGLAGERIAWVIDSLNALYSYAIRHDVVDFSPVVELSLPESENGSQYDLRTPPPFTAPGAPRTPPPFAAPRANGTPPSFTAPGANGTPPSFTVPATAWTPPPYAPPGFVSGEMPQPHLNGTSGFFPTMSGGSATAPEANYDATMQERWLWWTVRIIVIVFVLIALVLVAESV
jgi:hypothetical protein